MSVAIDLATESARTGGGPFGAVIVKDGSILAQAVNQVTSTNDPTAHAEIVAIREACRILGRFQLTDCEIYSSCEPCAMCAGAIFWTRPACVYYAATIHDAGSAGFDDVLIQTELCLPPEQRRIPMKQILRTESLVAFRTWQQNENRTRY